MPAQIPVALLALAAAVAAPPTFEPAGAALAPGPGVELLPSGGGAIGVSSEPGGICIVEIGEAGGIVVGSLVATAVGPRRGSLADVVGEGDRDLLLVHAAPPRLTLVRRSGAGWHAEPAIPLPAAPLAVAGIDLDGTGRAAAICALGAANTLAIVRFPEDGAPTIAERPAAGALPVAVAAAALDGDASLEIVVAHRGSETVAVRPASPDAPPMHVAATGALPSDLTLADLDGDGRLDVAVACAGDGTLTLLLTRNSGPPERRSLAAGPAPSRVRAADLDGDGRADLLTINGTNAALTLHRNQGMAVFQAAEIPLPARPAAVTTIDVDGDGRPDLLAADAGSRVLRALRRAAPGEPLCPGDLTGDLYVDLDDVNAVLLHFGEASDAGDANGDGVVDLADLNVVLVAFGRVCGDS